MPLLSTLGAASSQSFKGRGGPDLTMTASTIDLDMSFGSFSVASDEDIVSGDMLIVGQGSGDSDVTTFPNPVSDGYYSPPERVSSGWILRFQIMAHQGTVHKYVHHAAVAKSWPVEMSRVQQ